jgi:hypothetical protein
VVKATLTEKKKRERLYLSAVHQRGGCVGRRR